MGYPSYSKADNQLIFDNVNSGSVDLGITGLSSSKIESDGSNAFLYFEDTRWATWFSNGIRNFTSVNDLNIAKVKATIIPNPSADFVDFKFTVQNRQQTKVKVVSANGQNMDVFEINTLQGENSTRVDISDYPAGQYYIVTLLDSKIVTLPILKI